MNYNNLKIRNNIAAFDTETTGLNPYGDFKRWGYFPARPFAFSFSDDEGNNAFFRLEVDPFTRRVIPDKAVFKEVGAILGNPKIKKIGYNLGFDKRMALFSRLPFLGDFDDVLLMTHIVTGGSEFSYELKQIAKKYFQINSEDEKTLHEAVKKIRLASKKKGWKLADKENFGDKPYKADFWLAPTEILEPYAVKDSERTMFGYLLWTPEIEEDVRLKAVYAREKKLFNIIAGMESCGVHYYTDRAKELKKFFTAHRDKHIAIAEANGGKGLNFRSSPQLVKKFIQEKKYKALKLTKTGRAKIDTDFLVIAAEKGDKLAKSIVEYRTADHMLVGFLGNYGSLCVQENKLDIIHPNYKQIGARTGRLACTDPNLQQVADKNSASAGRRKADIDLNPRELFGPRPGYIWYMPDYCLHPDTLVRTLTGDKRIGDIVPGDLVLTYRKRRIKYGKVTRSVSVKPLPSYRLTFDNGESVIASSDHTWLTQSPIKKFPISKIYEKKTEELQLGERMVPFRQHRKETFYTVDGFMGYTKIHELVAEAYHGKRPKGYHTHHKDGNRENNIPENLEYKKEHVHLSEHSKKSYKKQDHTIRIKNLREALKYRRSYNGKDNPMYGKKQSKESKEKNRLKKSAWWKGHPEARITLGERNKERNLKNHTLIKKEFLGYQPMHTITVEPDHNYVLSCGVVTKNCQIELWIIAFQAKEEQMIKALLEGHDFHGSTGKAVWGNRPDYEKEAKKYRSRGKTLMFTKVYGGGVDKVAELIRCSPEEARAFINDFDATFPGLVRFMKRIITRVKRDGIIHNPFGRMYRIDADYAYKAVNYFVQGTAADIIKEAIIAVEALLRARWKGCELLLQIHDELVIEVPLKLHCKRLMREIIVAMQGDFHRAINCPRLLPVSMKIATKCWSETVEIKL